MINCSRILAATILSLAAVASMPAHAQYGDADGYAVGQCESGSWQVKGYPSYQSCYNAAVSYYFQQTGGSGGGTGGGGSGGGTFIGDLPALPSPDPCHSRLCDGGISTG